LLLFEKAQARMDTQNVAFLGLGVMGYPMAGHLSRAGYNVTVYNRTPERAAQWVEKHDGAKADTPASAAAGADFVMMCVGNDNDVRAVASAPDGALEAMRAGSTLVDRVGNRRTRALRRR
jgi:3-hydroxyisobutyrate dehydrogenase-like beta-hydroxyacid dehydrogenase